MYIKYFGTDGIRGIPFESLDENLIRKIGNACITLGIKKCVLGYDTRESSPKISNILIESLISVGIDVYVFGVISTPALIYYSKINKALGIIITASHNPYEYNGIKIVYKGLKLNHKQEEAIEYSIDHLNNKSKKIGKINYVDDPLYDYINHISKYYYHTNKKIIIDLANGSTCEAARIIYPNISNNIKLISNEPNGKNINKNCGSTSLNKLKEEIKNTNYDLGIAFDGDGDRVIIVNNNLDIIDGDLIIYILALYLKKNKKLKNNKIVLTIMSNLGIINCLKESNIEVLEANVGDKYVLDLINKNKLSLGGENSGHIILNDIFSSGDGILVSLLFLKAIDELNIDLNVFYKSLNLYSDRLLNINVKNKDLVINNTELKDLKNNIIKELNNDCKIIIRKSGTEDLLRLTVMTKKEELTNKYSEILKNKILEIDNTSI